MLIKKHSKEKNIMKMDFLLRKIIVIYRSNNIQMRIFISQKCIFLPKYSSKWVRSVLQMNILCESVGLYDHGG